MDSGTAFEDEHNKQVSLFFIWKDLLVGQLVWNMIEQWPRTDFDNQINLISCHLI